MKSPEDMIAAINKIVDAANGSNVEFAALVDNFLGKKPRKVRVKKVKEKHIKARRGIGSY